MMNSFVDSFSSNFHIEQPEIGKITSTSSTIISIWKVFQQKIGKFSFQASLNQMNNHPTKVINMHIEFWTVGGLLLSLSQNSDDSIMCLTMSFFWLIEFQSVFIN